MFRTKCGAALKLWPKSFWFKTDLTATYNKTNPLKSDKINLEFTIYYIIDWQILVKKHSNQQLQ